MQMVIRRNRFRHSRPRRGAIAPLLAISLPALIILIGFAINLAYMELVRGQLRITCDSAAKAALVQYGSSQSQSTACAFASGVAANNLVANQVLSFSIPTSSSATRPRTAAVCTSLPPAERPPTACK